MDFCQWLLKTLYAQCDAETTGFCNFGNAGMSLLTTPFPTHLAAKAPLGSASTQANRSRPPNQPILQTTYCKTLRQRCVVSCERCLLCQGLQKSPHSPDSGIPAGLSVLPLSSGKQLPIAETRRKSRMMRTASSSHECTPQMATLALLDRRSSLDVSTRYKCSSSGARPTDHKPNRPQCSLLVTFQSLKLLNDSHCSSPA